jgi:threonine/homoserine/homoserine lactone efflux protein
MSVSGLLIFSAVYFLAVATPGPGVAAVIARSLARGTQGAVAFIAGFLVGDLVLFAAAASGLVALAQSAQLLFTILKYLGAAYLMYLAFQLWTAPATREVDAPAAGQTPWQLFLGSLAMTMANPKAIVFFVALLPTVVELEQLTFSGFLEIAAVIAVVLPTVLGVYVLLAARARHLFGSVAALRRVNRSAGAAMASVAAAVATR